MSFDSFETELKSKKPLTTGITPPTKTGGSALDAFESQLGAKQESFTKRPPQESMVGGMFKSLATAPATMIARPFQAVQSAVQLGGMDIKGNEEKMKALNDESYRLALSLRTAREEEKPAIKARVQEIQNQVFDMANKLGEQAKWKPSAGGIVAEAPETWGDVKKDVGRGIQTVALGVGSPLAGGAAFGLGSSLEQGNDVFSMDTLYSTLGGATVGKLLGMVGKPILDYTGKVVGKYTPQMIKDVAAKGAGAVDDFMKQHKLLGDIAKPLSEKITKGAEDFDTAINKKTSSLWKGAKNIRDKQYPGLSDKAREQHFEQIQTDRLVGPAKEKATTFKSSADALAQAKAKGVNLEQKIKDTKIYDDISIDENGKFDTLDAQAALLDDTMSKSHEVLRPAFVAAEPGVQLVNNDEVLQAMLRRANASDMIPEDKAKFIQRIYKEYGPGSAEARAFKNGYKLSDLYDSKISRTKGVYKTPKGGGETTISDRLSIKEKEAESKAFDDLLRQRTPPGIGLDDYFKAQTENFELANYLKTLHGKVAPKSKFAKAMNVAGQMTGGLFGLKMGGPFGIFPGKQFGGILFNNIMSLPNPLRIAALERIPVKTPEIYALIKQFTEEMNTLAGSRLRLPAPTAIYQGPTQAGQPYTPNPSPMSAPPLFRGKY